jgi:hypothetical protein
MQYTRVKTDTRDAHIALDPTNFGAPYQALFDQTDASGHEVWLAESHNNFVNPMQQASEQRYANGWWAEIFRDVVRKNGGTDDKGRLNVTYLSHAGTEWEKPHNVWLPRNGYWVPTKDGVFVPETLVPFETVQNRGEAIKRMEAAGLPENYVSYFYRLDSYSSDRFVGRDFIPGLGDGRFDVIAYRSPSSSGHGRVASRPAYEKADVVDEVDATQAIKK